MLVVALTIDWLIANIGLFEMPTGITVVLGLILGEVSKYLNQSKNT